MTPQLPMSLAEIPLQGDSRIPMGGDRPANVDVLGQESRAYSLASQMNKVEQENLARQDQQIIQQALREGANLNTPDGIQSLAESLKGKVQPGTYEGLIKSKSALEEQALKIQDKFATMEADKLKVYQSKGDLVLKNLSGLLDEYDTTVKGKGLDVAVNEFNGRKQALIQALVESKAVDPEQAKLYFQMSPTQLKTMLETSKFWQDKMKEAAELQEKQARARKEGAQADQIEQGGAKVAELQAIEDRYGKESPEYKAALQRLGGAHGATNVEPTMTPDAVNLAAERLLKGDKSALQNIGRGVQGAANITAINNRVAELAKERGIDASKVLQAQSELGAAQKGLKDLAGRSAKIDAAVIEVDKFADNALQALDKVSRGNVVPVNEIMRRVAEGSGSPEEAAFSTYVKSLSGAYANVLGRGTTTVFSQTEADKIIRKDYSKEQFKAMIDAIKKEAQAVLQSSEGAGENIKKQAFGETKVDPKEQAKRESGRTSALQDELKKAEARREELNKDPKADADAKRRNDDDIAGLRRELKLGPESPKKKDDIPPKNAKGWELHKDSKGNYAYVSPDGKQYEEVR